jgi:tetratricopeptide (TPR) repeat protein
LEKYLQALSLAEAGKWQIKQNWNYLNLLATLVDAYYELKEYQEAAAFCRKALEVEPQFEWVRNTLYPKILKKINP